MELDFDGSEHKYYKDVGRIKPLTKAETKDLLIRYRGCGDRRLLNRIVEGNLKFAMHIIKNNYHSWYESGTFSKADLIAEANHGMIIAVDKFNMAMVDTVSFTSYAINWIRQQVNTFIDDNKTTVRVPPNRIIQSKKLKKHIDSGMTEEEACGTENLTVTDMAEINVTMSQADERSHVDEDWFCKMDNGMDNKRAVAKALEFLSDRERAIVSMYFGIDTDGDEMSLEDISKVVGVARERVRQIKFVAMRKMHRFMIDSGINRN